MKKMVKKILCFVLAIATVTGCFTMLAGCGNDNKSLVVNTMFGVGDNHEATFLRGNAAFVEKNAGTKIVNNSGVALDQNWLTSFAADMNSKNNVPDVVFYFSGAQMDRFRDKVVTVEEIRKEYPKFCEDIIINDNDPASIEMKTGAQAIMYNSDVYEAADFATVDTLKTEVKKNVSDTKKMASVSGDLPHYWFNHLMAHKLGVPEYEGLDGSKAFFTDAKKTTWKKAMYDTIMDMREIGFVGKGATNATEATAFYAGERGIAIDGQWVAGNVDKSSAKEKIKFAQFPADKDGNKFVIGGVTNGWYITKQAWENKEKRELAVKYVELMSSESYVDSFCNAGGGLPANGKAVSAAGYGATGFASILAGAKSIIAIDDRIPATAKAALFGDWSVSKAFPLLLEKATSPTQAEVDVIFDDFFSKLS